MRVETVITGDGRERYILLDNSHKPIAPVLKYLKFKDNNEAARNSLRAYCQHLKLYFEFLAQEGLDYRKVNIDDMASFMRWLKNPYSNSKITPVKQMKSPRKPETINTIMSTVLNFYDYLMRHEDYSIQLSEKLRKTIPGSRRGFKDFLYHITKDKDFAVKVLKVKVPKTRPKTLEKEQVEKLIDNCSNIRDKFLIKLLWVTGVRIGEALALWLEDFEIDAQKIHIVDRGELDNKAEIKTVHSPRVIDVSVELINDFMEYVAECHTDEVDTNHVFIKLDGLNKYQPLDHNAVNSLFRRLKEKTGIKFVSPHKLRHTHFTLLNEAGWTPEKMMKRGGWSDVQTVINKYVHPSDKEMRKEWDKTEKKKQFKIKPKEEL